MTTIKNTQAKTTQAEKILDNIRNLFAQASVDPTEIWCQEGKESSLKIVPDDECITLHHQHSECCIGVKNTENDFVEIYLCAKNINSKIAIETTFLIGGEIVHITEFKYAGNQLRNRFRICGTAYVTMLRFLTGIDYSLEKSTIEQVLYQFVSELFEDMEP